ncbi:MAG TPA: PQQ-binding-like beta-propeller repeat protein [Rhodanobacteraceae bacterium]|nr:PQQ-binding-like beta-propeller repeat protein [Rhodanobacteraceae bacterium]
MSRTLRAALFLLCAAGAAAPFDSARAQIDIVTERYDGARLGANLQETQLDTSNVNVSSFGKLWSYTVSGSVYAQPLYVRNVSIAGGTHNVLYVVTMNDMVYAFDADSGVDSPLQSFDITSGAPPGSFPPCIADILGFNDNIIGNVGIESTPVIDLSTNTIYVVARLEHSDNGACGGANRTFTQSLHALDMATFAERSGSPVIIGGSVPCAGSGTSCNSGTLTFDPKIEDQRSSLALSNSRIFIAWSSHSDQLPYHGWVMAYDATTLTQTMIWSSAPDGTPFNGAGVWMGGRAPAVDADNNVYYTTGNGTWDGVTNFGESFVKFGPTADAPLVDWFTPDAYNFLNNADLDLAGSGPILVPGTDLIISGGKGGIFYMTHTADLGHEMTGDLQIPQEFDNSRNPGDADQIKGGPVYWNRDSGLGPWMYVWSDGNNHFNAYHFNGATFDLPPVSQSTALSPQGSAGGVLTLSANGSTPGSGIVWVSMAIEDANSNVHAGRLRAFDADDLDTELWNSDQNQARDDAGNWPKFSPPTVVNGRVYLGSFPIDGVSDTAVNVYGLLVPPPPGDFTLAATPPNPGVNPGGSVQYSISTAEINNFSQPVHLDVSGLPTGATASFDTNDVVPPAQMTLTISTATLTQLGEYPLIITGTAGSLTHSVDVGLYVTDAVAGAGTISIDFVGASTALAAIDLAGVTAKPNWNEPADASGSALELLDESGADTGATLDWTADAVDALGIGSATPDFVMMDGFLDAMGNSTSITVTNLPADPNGYLVYVYADGNNGGSDSTGTYVLDGNDGMSSTITIIDAANATFDGNFVLANNSPGNYAVFSTTGTGFTLTTPGTSATMHAPLNGIQIVHGIPVDHDLIFTDGFDG